MGHTTKKLARRDLSGRTIFNNRFVIEVCEKMHIHYRNLRITLDLSDFVEFTRGCVQALERWGKLNSPEPRKGQHIELCRKKVATEAHNDGIQVNLNENLYNRNEGKIYSKGAEFKEEKYIHLKIRDLRLELSKAEFEELANAIIEAKEGLKHSDSGALLQKT